ncbi:cobaltochelatase subunit CobN [Pelosinus sp. sgz500959]|uniref:cobaltochelatase subunit CobN n=1 Tax=Pelosinus sp. sgz500959 TaxID=3242472 RepID=UPI00366FB4DA
MLTTTYKENIRRSHLLYGGLQHYSQQECDDPMSRSLVWNGIFHPLANQVFTNTKRYHHQFCQRKRLTVGIIFSRDEWVKGDTGNYSMLIDEIEKIDLNVIGIFSHWFGNNDKNIPSINETVEKYFYDHGIPIIDVLINCFEFSLTKRRPVDKTFLNQLGVPVLEGYNISHGGGTPSSGQFVNETSQEDSIPDLIKQMARRAKKWAFLHSEATMKNTERLI